MQNSGPQENDSAEAAEATLPRDAAAAAAAGGKLPKPAAAAVAVAEVAATDCQDGGGEWRRKVGEKGDGGDEGGEER